MTSTAERGRIEHLIPQTLARNPAFTNVVAVSGNVKMIYIGGQDAVSPSGSIVGQGDMRAQAEQIFTNLKAALAAAGAGLEHVVKWTIYVVNGQSPQPAFEVFQREWGDRPNPPAITMAFVAGLARPDFLAEIDAVAAVPL